MEWNLYNGVSKVYTQQNSFSECLKREIKNLPKNPFDAVASILG